jgi:hypothetical protein
MPAVGCKFGRVQALRQLVGPPSSAFDKDHGNWRSQQFARDRDARRAAANDADVCLER